MTERICLAYMFICSSQSQNTWLAQRGFWDTLDSSRLQKFNWNLVATLFPLLPNPLIPLFLWLLTLNATWVQLISYHSAACSYSRHRPRDTVPDCVNDPTRKGIQNHRQLLFAISVDKTKLNIHHVPKSLDVILAVFGWDLNAREVILLTQSSPGMI